MRLYKSMLFALMTCFLFAAASYGGTDELMKLLENRGFWSGYTFGTLEESELYRTRAFNLTASNYDSTFDFYDAAVKFDTLAASFKIKSENGKNIVMYFTYLPAAPLSDFDTLYQWCLSRYGKKHNYYERVKTESQAALTTREASWTLNNTVIQLSTSYMTKNSPPAGSSVPAGSSKTDFISLVFADRNAAKISKPTVTLLCKASLADKAVAAMKLDDIEVVIDENSGEVMNTDKTASGWSLKVSDRFYELTKSDADRNSVHVVINRRNWKLTGESLVDSLHRKYQLKGSCRKTEPGTKKNQ